MFLDFIHIQFSSTEENCNLYYEPIIKNLGETTGLLFLIDMNNVFENIVANFLVEYMGSNDIVVQKVEYLEIND